MNKNVKGMIRLKEKEEAINDETILGFSSRYFT